MAKRLYENRSSRLTYLIKKWAYDGKIDTTNVSPFYVYPGSGLTFYDKFKSWVYTKGKELRIKAIANKKTGKQRKQRGWHYV